MEIFVDLFLFINISETTHYNISHIIYRYQWINQ